MLHSGCMYSQMYRAYSGNILLARKVGRPVGGMQLPMACMAKEIVARASVTVEKSCISRDVLEILDRNMVSFILRSSPSSSRSGCNSKGSCRTGPCCRLIRVGNGCSRATAGLRNPSWSSSLNGTCWKKTRQLVAAVLQRAYWRQKFAIGARKRYQPMPCGVRETIVEKQAAGGEDPEECPASSFGEVWCRESLWRNGSKRRATRSSR
jgi:hypothetical protein